MDIMVKDRRAPSGWIFGNFQYNGALGPAQFENLVPVGVMWGEDPELTTDYYTPLPVKTYLNPLLRETIINPDENELPPTHLGWNGRLNGPVDNPQSSCMSCHMTAEFPQVSPMSPLFLPPNQVPAGGSKEWMRWFKNFPCGQPFDQGVELQDGSVVQSADGSLQLSESVQFFYQWLDDKGGVYAYGPDPANRHTPRLKHDGTPVHVHPVLRGAQE
jgi:hypothetical protein